MSALAKHQKYFPFLDLNSLCSCPQAEGLSFTSLKTTCLCLTCGYIETVPCICHQGAVVVNFAFMCVCFFFTVISEQFFFFHTSFSQFSVALLNGTFSFIAKPSCLLVPCLLTHSPCGPTPQPWKCWSGARGGDKRLCWDIPSSPGGLLPASLSSTNRQEVAIISLFASYVPFSTSTPFTLWWR